MNKVSRFELLCLETIQERDRRIKQYHEDLYKRIEKKGECEHCKRKGIKLNWVYSNTAYHWDKDTSTEDPNRPHYYCEECALEDAEYWEERWREYYSGCM